MSDRDEASFPSSAPDRSSPPPRRGRSVGHEFAPADRLDGEPTCDCGLNLAEVIDEVTFVGDSICDTWRAGKGLDGAGIRLLVDDATGVAP